MKAMVLERPGAGPRSLELQDVPDLALQPGELRLRVAACAVCRTDLQICRGDLNAHLLPLVPGHQIVGRIEEVGEGVSGFAVGARVGVGWLASADGSCSQCRSGRENLCQQARFIGWDQHGGYAERVIVRADFALRVPEALSDAALAPLLCGGVIGYRALKRSGVRPGQNLGLYGFGASARLAMQVARHWGCKVFVVTRGERDRKAALAQGAVWVGGTDELPPEPLQAAVTFAPAGQVVLSALRALDRGGTVAINAIHLDGMPAFPYDDLWWERSIASVANYTREDAREFLELAAKIPIRTSFEELPLQAANEALLRHERGEIDGAAVLIPK
jgi:alcohol dehydrogenase, propanol-preferring